MTVFIQYSEICRGKQLISAESKQGY